MSSSSKLSATVPAFIPGGTYTGVTSGGLSSELVIKSTLSPFVPEFRPLGSFAPLLSAPYQPTCSLLQHNSKQAHLKHQKVDLKEVCRSIMEMFLKTFTALKNGSGYFQCYKENDKHLKYVRNGFCSLANHTLKGLSCSKTTNNSTVVIWA